MAKRKLFLSTEEAAQRLRCTRQAVRDRIVGGSLRGVMIGGRWMVEAAEVDTLLELGGLRPYGGRRNGAA